MAFRDKQPRPHLQPSHLRLQLNAEMTPKADVWAAGVMLYHLLSGRFPFWDAPADIVRRLPLHEVMVAVSSKPLVLDGPALSHVSRPARDLLMEMLGEEGAAGRG
eukprot:107363-Chlamydomonas_euryale.AAC.6